MPEKLAKEELPANKDMVEFCACLVGPILFYPQRRDSFQEGAWTKVRPFLWLSPNDLCAGLNKMAGQFHDNL